MRKTKAVRPARSTNTRPGSASAIVFHLLILLLLPLVFAAENAPPPSSPRPGSAPFLETLSESERAWLSAHPVISVVQDPNYYPVEFEDKGGNPAGISSDYLLRIEERIGIRFERLTGIPWQEAYGLLKNWKIDMTTCVAATPEREEFWAFTEPYLTIPIVIATRNDVTYIADMEELEGKEVAVVDGYAAQEWIRRDYPGITLVPVATIEEGLDLVTTERAYAFIDNLLLIGSALSRQRNTAIKIAGGTPYVNAQRMAVRKDWAIFAGILQKAMESMPQTVHDEIYKKWVPVRFEYGLDRTVLKRVIPPAAVVLIVLLLWILRLRMEIRRKKVAEAALRAEHQRLENILEATQAGTWEWNVRTGEILVNSQWGRIIRVRARGTPPDQHGNAGSFHPSGGSGRPRPASRAAPARRDSVLLRGDPHEKQERDMDVAAYPRQRHRKGPGRQPPHDVRRSLRHLGKQNRLKRNSNEPG